MAEVGAVVGSRYTILTQIGKGGMSTVYLAMDTTLNKQWAVKEIRHIEDHSQRDVIIHSLISEANLIKTFDHPAIPRVVDLIEEEGSLYIVMDYVEGSTLQRIIDTKGSQGESEVVSWGVQLCDALDYLHNRKPPIVYRDMKPSNIMITPEGLARIIDFGIACPMPPAEGPLPEGYQAQLGTKGYAAPEQYDSLGRVSARTDVYGLAAVLYVALTGKPIGDEPYRARPLRQAIPDASEGLERVLQKAMQKDPEQRFSNCAEFAYALEHYTEHDAARQKTLVLKWRAFCTACIVAVVCLVGAGTATAANAITLNSDFNHQMQLAAQASNDDFAESHYVTAADIRPNDTRPYHGLIERYQSDGVFSSAEEQQLQQMLADHTNSIQKNEKEWGRLAFDIGKLYWYYYLPKGMTGFDGSNTQLQYARMRVADNWMKTASQIDFQDQELAKLYFTIADFNVKIVPLINEGSDAGKYTPYLHELNRFMDTMSTSDNDVMRLTIVNLTLNAIQTYPRKFRADGIKQDELSATIDKAQQLAGKTHPTTDELNASYKTAMDLVARDRQAVAEAYVDITGKEGA